MTPFEFGRVGEQECGGQDKTMIYLSQRDALKFMHAKNVPGFTDELIDTYARKMEGQETWTVRESKGQ